MIAIRSGYGAYNPTEFHRAYKNPTPAWTVGASGNRGCTPSTLCKPEANNCFNNFGSIACSPLAGLQTNLAGFQASTRFREHCTR